MIQTEIDKGPHVTNNSIIFTICFNLLAAPNQRPVVVKNTIGDSGPSLLEVLHKGLQLHNASLLQCARRELNAG